MMSHGLHMGTMEQNVAWNKLTNDLHLKWKELSSFSFSGKVYCENVKNTVVNEFIIRKREE